MVPRSLQRQLNRLRRRERLLRLTWAAARCLAVFGVVLAAACLLDFSVDLYRDTPRWLRAGLLLIQAALWLAGAGFVLRGLFRRMTDTQVALWIEEKIPELGHRLISAVQLNRRGAAIRGMSPELIVAVTRQAEEQAAAADFAQVADARRLKWAGALLAPLAVAAALLALLCPDTLRALLARQFLDDRPIPRALAIESVLSRQVWPEGEEGVLRFRVTGAAAPHLKGEVRLDPRDGGRSERHDLVFESQDESGTATFVARVPPSARDFSYHAWLKDGRTHRPAEVHFEPRPVVQKQEAWVQLPPSIGLKPGGQPFEEPQKGADIVYRLAGSTARVVIETQKPVVKATVEVLGPSQVITAPVKAGTRAEVVRRSVDLVVEEGGRRAEGTFPFAPAAQGDALQPETAYRILVQDEFGLENSDKPRRGIRTGSVDPPEVALLPETFGKSGSRASEEDEIEGIPILLGQRLPLAYECSATYGLSHARLRYRVIPRGRSRDEEAGEPAEKDFLTLPLGPPRGQTQNISKKAREEFSTEPAADPDKVPGTKGGGRYDFNSAGIPDGKGGLLELREGDHIQFYVEVFGRAEPDGRPGRSTMREKEVVGQQDFLAWVSKKDEQKERIRQLEEKQRGAGGATSLLPDERPLPSPVAVPARERPGGGMLDGDAVFGRSWQLIGPFPNDKDAGHARAYPPETEAFNLVREYDGLKGKVRWQPHHSQADKIDLERVFNHGEAGVAYAVCWVSSANKTAAVLATGSDDGIKVWLNRKLVLDRAVHREAVPADDRTPITLAAGWNEVLVKVDNRFGTWAFYLDLLDPRTDRPLAGPRATVRTAPPGKEEKNAVKDWQMIGPFPNINRRGHNLVFAPELGTVNLQRDYPNQGRRLRWQPHHSATARIDLREAFGLRGEDTQAVGYAVCWVRSDRKRSAVLAARTEGGIKVWISRKSVLDRPARREEPAVDLAPVTLEAGWNEVRIKLDSGGGRWGLQVELRDPPTGDPLPGVEYRITPPDKK